MEQRLNLERTLRDEREKLNTMRVDVRELEHKVNQKMLVRLGPLNMRQGDVVRRLGKQNRSNRILVYWIIRMVFPFPFCSVFWMALSYAFTFFQMKNTDALERDIGVLRNNCDKMADEVTKITKGAGEEKVENT